MPTIMPALKPKRESCQPKDPDQMWIKKVELTKTINDQRIHNQFEFQKLQFAASSHEDDDNDDDYQHTHTHKHNQNSKKN